ncbi:MAG: prephenate dehydratase [Halothermotrichaceae bacterium]
MDDLKCGYLGPAGTFTEKACLQYYGDKAQLVPLKSINNIFDKLHSGILQRGIIPVENSLEGPINQSLDLLFTNSLVTIIGEVIVPIRHFLMAADGVKIKDINKLYSHTQIIGQSSRFINKYLSDVEIIFTGSSAQAAEIVINKKDKAMIGPERISMLYDLNILKGNIQDNNNNYTRFFVVANKLDINNKTPEFKKDYKTSIICAPKINESGALYNILGEFAREDVNLTRIESRPTKRQLGEYLFYIDFEGHHADENIKRTLNNVEKRSSFYKLLGSYQKAKI